MSDNRPGPGSGRSELALIGRPVGQSLSPAIFNGFREAGAADLTYRTLDTGPEDLADRVRALRKAPAQRGFNVTIPHKAAVIPMLDAVEAVAAALGAINTVHLSDGLATGYNTDLDGIEATLDGAGIEVTGRSAVLFGAGGAARAVASVLARRGLAELTVVARGRERADAFVAWLAGHAPDLPVRLTDQAPAAAALYVNATPVAEGLLPANVGTDAWAFDLAYRPRPITPFTALAREKGLRAVDGLPMLVAQAAAAYRIWFGQALPGEAESRVLQMLEQKVC